MFLYQGSIMLGYNLTVMKNNLHEVLRTLQ